MTRERTHAYDLPQLTIDECVIMIAVATAVSVGVGMLSGLSLVDAFHLLKLAWRLDGLGTLC